MTEQTNSAVAERKGRPQHILTVTSTQWLGPHLVRVILSGESLADFGGDGSTDAYVKLTFVDPSLGPQPPYDMAALRESLPADKRPVIRTYTVRWIDREARQLALDFVTHGDAGVAAPWATKAQPGDVLVLSGPGGGYSPNPDAAWHVFVGDLSALPAISAALESLPAQATGVAYLEIQQEEDIVEISHASQVDVQWLINPDDSDIGFLARVVDDAQWPVAADQVGGIQVFAHGERESIKAIRKSLAKRGIPRDAISISGYWARGRTEDAFQAEKREPIGKID